MLICQLVGDMGTTFWCITLFLPMLVTEATWSSTCTLRVTRQISPQPKMICFLIQSFLMENIPQKIFYKHISVLVFELLAISCLMSQIEVSFLGGFTLMISDRMGGFGWFLLQMKDLAEFYHIKWFQMAAIYVHCQVLGH